MVIPQPVFPIWKKHLNVLTRLLETSAGHILMPSFNATHFLQGRTISETDLL